VAEIIAELSRCLAPVRPVGMGSDAAHEWLTVIAAEVRHLDRSTLRMACSEAREKCDDHRQILKAILNSEAVADERRFKALRRTMEPQRIAASTGTQRIGHLKAVTDGREA